MINGRTLVLGGAVVLSAAMGARAEKVNFAKEVRPIFADTCYKCHGPEKQKGKFRLDSAEGIMKPGEDEDGKPAVIPGKPKDSDLLRRVKLTADDDDVMPPKGDLLKPAQIALIERWIQEGADFGGWKNDAAAAAAATKAHGGDVKLPEVSPADPAALAKLHDAGALAMPLARNTHLLNVDFRAEADKTTDSQLALLASVAEQVAWLNLGSSKITDAGLAHLKGLKNLRRLHLERTAVTDAGLANLAGLSALEYLNLYGTQVTDAGLQQVRKLPNLKHLYLWQSKVTEAGVESLRKDRPGLVIVSGFEKPATPPDHADAAPAPAKHVKKKAG